MKRFNQVIVMLFLFILFGCSTPENGWEGTKMINQIPSTYNKETGIVTSRFPAYTVSFKLPEGYEPVETGSKEEVGPVFQHVKSSRYFGIKVLPMEANINGVAVQQEMKKNFPQTKEFSVAKNPAIQINMDPYKNKEDAKLMQLDEQSVENMKDLWMSMNIVYANTHTVRLDMTGLRKDQEMPQHAKTILDSMQIQKN